MKNQWSTTVSDWQGVDDEPTSDSNNLVKSGGVLRFIYDNTIVGAGNTPREVCIQGLKAGQYELMFENDTAWDLTGVSQYSALYVTENDNNIILIQHTEFTEKYKRIYVFDKSQDNTDIIVGIRAKRGLSVNFSLHPSYVNERLQQHISIGNGNTRVDKSITGLKTGLYVVRFANNSAWDMSGITLFENQYTALALYEKSGDTIIKTFYNIYTDNFADEWKKVLYFYKENDETSIMLQIRATVGVEIYFSISPDYTDIDAKNNSLNPINSNAVFKIKSTLEKILNAESNPIPSPIFAKTGYYIKADGTINTSSYWHQSNIITLYKGQTVEIESNGTGSLAPVIAKVENDTYIPLVMYPGGGSQVYAQYKYTVDETCDVIIQYNEKRSIQIYNNSERIIAIEEHLSILDEEIKRDAVKEYIIQERERVYNELVDRVNSDCLIVAFNTDQHFSAAYLGSGNYYDPTYVMNGIHSIVDIASKIPFDCIVLGGDIPGYDSPSFELYGIFDDINMALKPFSSINTPFVSIPGNHDAFQNNVNMTAQGMYNVHFKKSKWIKNIVHAGIDNCDCYYDDSDKKIRYIFIDTFSRNVRTESFTEFLTNTLSSMESDYQCLIFSHNPLTNEFAGIVQKYNSAGELTNAFENPTDLHSIIDQYANKVIACICGHSHADVYAISNSGILYIETTTAAPHTLGHWENIPYQKTIGTVTETAFDIFVIDKDAQTIEAVRYGQGTNRKWKYKGDGQGLISYKNCVSGAVSTPSLTLTFTNSSDNTDVVNVTCDAHGFYEVYLTLGATYTITCNGYTLDVRSVEVSENKEVNITATSE